jgi:hypothetical protein
VQRAEFKRAFEKAEAKYPRIHMGIAWRFILDFEAALRADAVKLQSERQGFGLLIRLTLNGAKIGEKSERTMYAALAGFLFGNRGVHQKTRRRMRGLPSARGKKQSHPSYEVEANEKGQLEWKL